MKKKDKGAVIFILGLIFFSIGLFYLLIKGQSATFFYPLLLIFTVLFFIGIAFFFIGTSLMSIEADD
jgi:hypothetical protein